MTDVNKQLERAKKFLEKSRIEDAIDAYLAVLEEAPAHPSYSGARDLYAGRSSLNARGLLRNVF